MSSPDIKLEAEGHFRSHWCDYDAFYTWFSEQQAQGEFPLASMIERRRPGCVERPRKRRPWRVYRKIIFMEKFGIDETTYDAWLCEWTGGKSCRRANEKANEGELAEDSDSSSSASSYSSKKIRNPVVPSKTAKLEATLAPDTQQPVIGANLGASSDESSDKSSDESSDESLDESSDDSSDESLDDSPTDESSSESQSDEDEHTQEDTARLTVQNVPVDQRPSSGIRADAPCSSGRSSMKSSGIDAALDRPNATRSTVVSRKEHITNLVKALAPNCEVELDDDTSAELFALLREAGQRFAHVMQRKVAEAKAKAREAELMEEIRVLKEQVANNGSAQKSLRTRLEAIIEDLQAAPIEPSDVTGPLGAESTRKRKPSLHEDDTRPSQRARRVSDLVPQ